jgi:hypothetical protein
LDLSKLVNPGYVARVEVAVQEWILCGSNSGNKRAHKPIDVEPCLVEADCGQDDGVRNFGVLNDSGMGGVGAVGESHDGDLVGLSDAASVISTADEAG